MAGQIVQHKKLHHNDDMMHILNLLLMQLSIACASHFACTAASDACNSASYLLASSYEGNMLRQAGIVALKGHGHTQHMFQAVILQNVGV